MREEVPLIPSLQKFGDRETWTQDKLERVRKYLVAYSIIMSKRRYPYTRIHRWIRRRSYHELDCEADGEEVSLPKNWRSRRSRRSWTVRRDHNQVEPRFNKYIFIEKSRKKTAELEKLREEFPDRAADIIIETAEANALLQKLCLERTWKDHRAVLFIDPFRMQLTWRPSPPSVRRRRSTPGFYSR